MKAVVAVVVSMSLTGAFAAQATPVQKVVELMESMLNKGKSEKRKEQVQYAAYHEWCQDTTRNKENAVKDAKQTIDVLKADIEGYKARVAQLTSEIAELDNDIKVWAGDTKAASLVRDIEKADYDATHKDYSESIDALERAIDLLKKKAKNRKQAVFMQISNMKQLVLIPPEAKRVFDAFLSEEDSDSDSDESAARAPEANGYEFQSQGIIDMMAKLLDKFVKERTDLEKEEISRRQAFELLLSDLSLQSEQADEDRSEKAEEKATILKSKADAEGDLADETASLSADSTYLADLITECKQKAVDFEARQQLRAEELDAIQKAIDVIASGAVSGSANKYLPALVQNKQAKKKVMLLQLSTDSQNAMRARVSVYLHDQAKRLESRILSVLAQRTAASPFDKVIKMVEDLIMRLQEEASDEAAHKGWCDMELRLNKKTRQAKSEAVETLQSEIDGMKSAIAKLAEEVSNLSEAVAELDKAMKDATKLRNEEKDENAQTVTDAQEAQTAVAQAVTILKEFYSKAADSTALLQHKKNKQPEIFDSPYKGMQGESGGVLGMLEVVQSDFARLESETSAAEATAQKEYEAFMSDSTIDKASQSKDIEHKSAKKQDFQKFSIVKQTDLENTQEELTKAMAYFDKLKPSCVESSVSYEDRAERRKEEIESLREALRILNGDDIA